MSDEAPKWDNMPEAHPLLSLSWEDVWDRAKDVTQDRFKRDPARDEVTRIFEIIKSKGMAADAGSFWDTVDYHVNEFYGNLGK